MPRRSLPPVGDGPHLGAFDLDTEVPTPHGVAAVADLEPGVQVFGSDGRGVSVLEVSDVLEGHDCFEVAFSTGEHLVLDADQRLLTERRDLPRTSAAPRRRAAVDLAEGIAAFGPAAYAVRVAPAVQTARKRLPIDPYLFGVWLGAGLPDLPAVRNAEADLLRRLTQAGVRVFTSGIAGRHWIAMPGSIRRGADLGTRLKELGVLGDKHVPMLYLRSSEDQRRQLLAGLLDSAAGVSDGGEILFRAPSAGVAIGVHQLIASLGLRPWFRPGRPVVDIGFVTGAQVFSREGLHQLVQVRRRLAAEVRPRRLVVSVAPVRSRPVRQVRVAADDGLFLVGRSFIPMPGAVREPAALVRARA